LKKEDEAKKVAAKNAKQKEAKVKLNMLLEAMSKVHSLTYLTKCFN